MDDLGLVKIFIENGFIQRFVRWLENESDRVDLRVRMILLFDVYVWAHACNKDGMMPMVLIIDNKTILHCRKFRIECAAL